MIVDPLDGKIIRKIFDLALSGMGGFKIMREMNRLQIPNTSIYGIDFYYEGGPIWESSIPRKGKAAEQGCIGCPWYDIERWRRELKKKLEEE